MALKIFSPGLDQYGPGGTARIKTLVIGGPGSGKTRWSSFFPKPFFADSEAGLASIADRGTAVAATKISTSDDMLELLKYMDAECRKAPADRKYETLVIDTLDAFQRKVKDEWLRKNPGADSFRGFDAWGYLDGKMQMLLTRLLNLDMNIVVCVHYDEKTVTEGSGEKAEQRQIVQLQLQGNVKDQVFNDFDLVGWMGVFFQQVDGQRVQKRGLSFQPTFERPFLKDRLNVTPNWMEVTFSEQDYADLFGAIASKIDQLPPTQELGVIESQGPEGVVGGALLEGGALPEVSPKDVPLEQFDKPTLQAMCRKFVPPIEFKSNTIKAELIQWIRERREQLAKDGKADPTIPGSTDSAPAETSTEAKTDDTSAAPGQPTAERAAQPAETAPEQPAETPAEQPDQSATQPEAAATATETTTEEPATTASSPSEDNSPPVDGKPDESGVAQTEAGPVNVQTGEIATPTGESTQDAAVAAAQEGLGGEVVSERSSDDAASTAVSAQPPAPVAAQAPPASQGPAAGPNGTCEFEGGCDVDLSKENGDLVKLSYIKFRKKLCNPHYQAARNASQ